MRISYNWLSDLVEELPPVDRLAELLTDAGLEVEAIERLGSGLEMVVVGQVKAKVPVEGSDKLNVCQVDVGGGETLQIVCGASNYEVGAKVPTALPGAVLPNGMSIESRPLRGVMSSGMLCSEVELGLSDEGEGLMILEGDAPVGEGIVAHLGLDDVVLTINATPNRPDWLSHLGVARDLAALTGTRLRLPSASPAETGGDVAGAASVEIVAADRCGRYAARVVEGVAFGPSPRWMQQRLAACGIRALGNVIDVTNYVLLETGHPLHAFDLEKVEGQKLVIRMAREGETITTLDEKERKLSTDDLVIADTEKALVIAGVMGGADAEVGEGTTRVLIESAWFQPSGVRRSSRRHGLHTESSHRFERGADPEAVRFALDRAAELMQQLTGGRVRAGAIDLWPGKAAPAVVGLRYHRVGELLGVDVPAEESRRILLNLGFEPVEETGAAIRVAVPSFRTDISREADLIEEIARIRGYASIPAATPRAPARPVADSRAQQVVSRVRDAMAAAGLDEVLNYAFVDPKDLAALVPGSTPGPALPLRNPLVETQSVMRTTLIPGLLRNAGFNRNRQVEDLRLYEVGKAYLPEPAATSPVKEPSRVAGLLMGSRRPASWAEAAAPVDFYDAKGVIESMLQNLGVADVSWEHGSAPHLHPRSAAGVRVGGVEIGQVGEIHPLVAEAFDLPRGVFVFELSLDELVGSLQVLPTYHGVPKFPAILRDLAVVVPTEVSAARIDAVLRGPAGEGFVEDVELFDVYEGPQLGEGRKSLAFAIRYRVPDRTLTDDEISRVHQALVAALKEQVGAELRG